MAFLTLKHETYTKCVSFPSLKGRIFVLVTVPAGEKKFETSP